MKSGTMYRLSAGLFFSVLFAMPALAEPPGTLIDVRMTSTVGVVLDEFPSGPLRDAAAAFYRHRSDQFWEDRARRQIEHMLYRSPLRQHNVLEFSACHQHYHFSHYGEFSLGPASSGKRAFCVESTQRHVNTEWSPLVHPYSCHNQGVEAGWGDDYIAGIECQWIDITDLTIPPGARRRSHSGSV